MPVHTSRKDIPQYGLEESRQLHRVPGDTSAFGYNNLAPAARIKGFELYSSEGVRAQLGPLKSDYYRISISVRGTTEIQLGLEDFTHGNGTISFTFPGQIFSKRGLSDDAFGYYLLFEPEFLEGIISADRIPVEFPFFAFAGVPFMQLSPAELEITVDFAERMNAELQRHQPGHDKAVRLYLYLMLLELKRSYLRQGFDITERDEKPAYLVPRYKKLVSEHFLTKRKVADYAAILGVTPNHLNRAIREHTGRTASEAITDMLVREAKAVLRYTDTTIAGISDQLHFSDPAGFNRFFKEKTGLTPLAFRKNAVSG
ncbi:helix-turn-helix domain-containing protein [Chitinophaga varians]|uniref:helix-turn-helix domain-containing protein n=1 Tax=Chitinophaga varians TaxID=2202339 RepID=UPI00165FAB81|nr:AraC family transcriptional regulator [Chitinophaga varians]MBC9911847.1 helix-turn-helix transcriptional regulator [Chitinophaga varians]